jgi:hypothetical protein
LWLAAAQAEQSVVPVGARKQLLIDRKFIAASENVVLRGPD